MSALTPLIRRRIVLMRHGSVTYFDAEGRPLPPDTVPLNEDGRRQADAAGRLFATEQLRFDRVITSTLPRTIETARRVLAVSGQSIEPESWAALEEIRGGRLSELADADVRDAFLQAFSGAADDACQFLGGETVGALMQRVLPCIATLRADPNWDTVLMVLHGGVNRAILSHALTGGHRFFGGFEQAAGCINVLDVGPDASDWVVRVVNHSPLSPLQTGLRSTTMEIFYNEYKKFRRS